MSRTITLECYVPVYASRRITLEVDQDKWEFMSKDEQRDFFFDNADSDSLCWHCEDILESEYPDNLNSDLMDEVGEENFPIQESSH
jgi:hypothetical protein